MHCFVILDTKGEVKVAALFPTFNVSSKLYTIAEGQVGITLDYDDMLIYYSKVSYYFVDLKDLKSKGVVIPDLLSGAQKK